MILIPGVSEALTEHLRQALQTLPELCAQGEEIPEAVGAAVAHYLLEQGLKLPLPDDYLHLLAYRALRSLGRNEAAVAWADRCFPDRAEALPVFDPDVWPGPVPLIVWQLFASGLVRPSRTVTVEGRLLWTLDFRRLRKEQAGWLELTLFPGLRSLLVQLAPAWDETDGVGLLGLRGLYAVGFAPTPRHRKRTSRRRRGAWAPLNAGEIYAYCRRVLAHLREEHGWKREPDVLYLDL